jgi:hypothetical protein
MAERLKKAGAAAVGEARIAAIAPTIVATAEETGANLIVMSTHTLTGAARALLASVANEVARTAGRRSCLPIGAWAAAHFATAQVGRGPVLPFSFSSVVSTGPLACPDSPDA